MSFSVCSKERKGLNHARKLAGEKALPVGSVIPIGADVLIGFSSDELFDVILSQPEFSVRVFPMSSLNIRMEHVFFSEDGVHVSEINEDESMSEQYVMDRAKFTEEYAGYNWICFQDDDWYKSYAENL